MRIFVRLSLLLLALCAVPGVALAHEEFLDHPAPPPGVAGSAPPTTTSQDPPGKWTFVGSIATGNPHSDLDFFERGGDQFASVGTLGAGPNGGGQTIIQLTQGGRVSPRYVGRHPSASCVVNEAAALGLQHDVESSPKGDTILNSFNPFASREDTKVIIDATDASGRCHDSQFFGGAVAQGQGLPDKRGGLEIVDVTDPTGPKEIGLTRHVGEAHTVNIDPKRPGIAYAVTSDAVNVDTNGRRTNETSGNALDGFEVVDFRNCLASAGVGSLADRRAACDPTVYRYRYEKTEMALGHTNKSQVYGCHELEIYPNDRLTCGSGAALMVFDMSGAFDDKGTPDDFTDDTPRGTPLPCTRTGSASIVFRTGAAVEDCVDGQGPGTDDLTVSKWLDAGAPSLQGVRFLGSVFHMGRGGPRPVQEDIDFNHEAELSASGNLLLATDERGGGVTPPGASCAQNNPSQLNQSNGGLHFYRADKLLPSTPGSADVADQAYARQPDGKKAIFRATPRTGAQATVCTAHVMQQIPGQNRIFMGWYSQGTQVIDFEERPDGTVRLKEVGHFIPTNANEWVSAIFKVEENPDGTFTYHGATGDFNLGERGRNAIDIYKVTLPPPPTPADGPGVIGRRTVTINGQQVEVTTRSGAPQCVYSPTLTRAGVQRRGGGLTVTSASTSPVTVDVFRQSRGRQVLGERLVRRFTNARPTFRWNGRDRRGRRLGNGYYVVRFRTTNANGVVETRRLALRRRGGRFRGVPAYDRREDCGLIRSFKLERPVFGGRTNRALNLSMRFGDQTSAEVVIRRGGRVVRRFPATDYRGGLSHRKRVSVTRRLRRGRYTVTVTARSGGTTQTATLSAVRL